MNATQVGAVGPAMMNDERGKMKWRCRVRKRPTENRRQIRISTDGYGSWCCWSPCSNAGGEMPQTPGCRFRPPRHSVIFRTYPYLSVPAPPSPRSVALAYAPFQAVARRAKAEAKRPRIRACRQRSCVARQNVRARRFRSRARQKSKKKARGFPRAGEANQPRIT